MRHGLGTRGVEMAVAPNLQVPEGGGARRGPRTPISTTVLSVSRLGPSMRRVVVGGPGLAGFAPGEFTDAYVKLIFLHPGVEYPRPLDLNAIREQLPPDQWPKQRTYTVRAWDDEAKHLTIDFVVHGDSGLAGPWAIGAQPGDELLLIGPGGGYAPDPAADWHLLVGDESALPAIGAALDRLPPTALGDVFVEVEGPEHEQALSVPEGVRLHWVHAGGHPEHGVHAWGEALVEAVTALEFRPGQVQAFVHGEAGTVRRLRRLLRHDRGLSLAQLSISGYWRQGADDETWRAVKRDFNREIEESEAGLGVK